MRATLYEGEAAPIDVGDVRAWVLALAHVVGLPRLRLLQPIIAAPDRETLVQMQIVGAVIDTLRLRGVSSGTG